MNSVLHNFSSSLKSIPTASSWFEAYVALSTSMMLLKTATNQFIPVSVRTYIMSGLKSYFFGSVAGVSNSLVTLTIPEVWENMGRNELYHENHREKVMDSYLPHILNKYMLGN
jgi:hypothetical protein